VAINAFGRKNVTIRDLIVDGNRAGLGDVRVPCPPPTSEKGRPFSTNGNCITGALISLGGGGGTDAEEVNGILVEKVRAWERGTGARSTFTEAFPRSAERRAAVHTLVAAKEPTPHL
jgi:hypothetical protein